MNFYTLNELNIKLVDFIALLSPLGDVKKIVSNGIRHLVEIKFHDSIINNINNNINDNINDNINNNINYTNKDLNKTIIKIYKDNNLGYIISNNTGILELPKGIEDNDEYLNSLKDKNKENISKFIRKTLPKDCQKISKKKLVLGDCKCTDPEKINIINFPGYRQVSV